jgi:transcriptional regulator with XRE-family HTH domain
MGKARHNLKENWQDAKTPLAVFRRELSGARLFYGLTYKQLAKKSGVHFSNIAELESGKRIPTFLAAKKLARALGDPALIDHAEELVVWWWKHKEIGPDKDPSE